MVPNYRTITISAPTETNIVPLIYEELKKTGYRTPRFVLDFIGFQADAGTIVQINGNPVKVPPNGTLYTPYFSGSDFLQIRSVVFPTALTNKDLWIIY